MDIEIVAPLKTDNGIVFYVSADGKKTGVSVSGLERLVGLKPFSSLFSVKRYPIFHRMSTNEPLRENDSKWLQPVWGNVFHPLLRGSDGANIVTSKAAVCIIKYFAFEKGSDVAMQSLDAFMEIGFDTWVKEIVKFSSEPSLNTRLLETMKLMNDKLDAVSAKVSKWDKIEGITATVYPGMKLLNDSLSEVEIARLLPSDELYTIQQWFAIKGIVVDKATLYSFARQAADTYKTMTGKRPQVKYKVSLGTGKKAKEGNGYKIVDFVILESAWSAFNEK